ncbi:MAG: hypothetical protein HDS71_03095 [Bacteroidales bacterium]|nr:hypothetical protein [Bacteroidales bacterium]MBD5206529.1 hypothetical protein [Bacteroidales bacterium]MBD5223026.1 hypothetical protein [Bacteroidales bacterium]MBD5301835.1 hypothetical protein [Bacteroides sp.]MBD5348498.1 hypothetical protein [Bacteroides sp.]
MASKREFKKYVDALGASVIDEMVSSYYNVEGVDKDKISKAIEQVLGAVGAAKSHSNIYFDRGVKAFESKKEYAKGKKEFFISLFDKIQTEFDEEINQALKLFNEALPEEVKAHNKEVANS